MNWFRNILVKPPDLTGLAIGQAGERWTAFLYEKEGYRIIARNYAAFGKKQLGELDIVCIKGRILVAVEVKTRRNENFMQIEESIGKKKQNLLRRMIKIFVKKNPKYENFNLRIDVAAVLIDPVDNSIKSVRILRNVIEDSDA